MQIPIFAKVKDRDGLSYKIHGLVLQQAGQAVTHLVVNDATQPKEQYLVPIRFIGTLSGKLLNLTCTREEMKPVSTLPSDSLIVQHNARVKATDGFVGNLYRFDLAPKTGQINALVVEEGILRGHKHVNLPRALLGSFEPGIVNVNADKYSIDHMPKVV